MEKQVGPARPHPTRSQGHSSSRACSCPVSPCRSGPGPGHVYPHGPRTPSPCLHGKSNPLPASRPAEPFTELEDTGLSCLEGLQLTASGDVRSWLSTKQDVPDAKFSKLRMSMGS